MARPEPLRPLRVLIVEDSDDDALLLLRRLRKGGYLPRHRGCSPTRRCARRAPTYSGQLKDSHAARSTYPLAMYSVTPDLYLQS